MIKPVSPLKRLLVSDLLKTSGQHNMKFRVKDLLPKLRIKVTEMSKNPILIDISVITVVVGNWERIHFHLNFHPI